MRSTSLKSFAAAVFLMRLCATELLVTTKKLPDNVAKNKSDKLVDV